MPTRHLFVYGSLTDREIMQAVVGRRLRCEPALLDDHRALALRHQHYPGLARASGATVEGRLYRNLRGADLTRLDAFEGAWYRRERVVVRVSPTRAWSARSRAFVYRTSPRGRPFLLDAPWSREEFMGLHRARFLRFWRARLRAPLPSPGHGDVGCGGDRVRLERRPGQP